MIKTAICDDEKYFVDELHMRIRDFFLKKRVDFQITDYISGTSLLDRADNYDLIFLDVQMCDPDGFKTAEILRNNGFSGSIIFVTIMKDDVYKAFEYGTFDYLVKPLSKDKLEHTMERYLKTLRCNEKQLVITRKNEQSVIKTTDILYCEVINRKVNLHLANGKTIEYYDKISELEHKLGGDFFKSHRSYLVNLKRVAGCGANQITLDTDEKIPLSRGRKSALMNALIESIDSGVI